MTDILFLLATIAIIIVVIILALGLWNMMRGGSNEFSQKMMRYRVIVQFVVVIIMLAALYFVGR
ncbi:MAG: twin transmembrane helix small protein [Hyphomicrobiales bacterium]|nr:twin transmembrane helix small protein [Hyphomicrobiales bacterium]